MKASASEITSGSAFVEAETWRSNQDQDKDYSSHAGTRDDTAPAETDSNTSNSLSKPRKHSSQNLTFFLSYPEGSRRFSLSFSDQEHPDNEAMKSESNRTSGLKYSADEERKQRSTKGQLQHDLIGK